jgi:hypothetical protein
MWTIVMTNVEILLGNALTSLYFVNKQDLQMAPLPLSKHVWKDLLGVLYVGIDTYVMVINVLKMMKMGGTLRMIVEGSVFFPQSGVVLMANV